MAITDSDLLLDALGNNSRRFKMEKASIANQTAGRWCSMWRGLGWPGQAAIPSTAAVPTKATLGAAVNFTNQTPPAKAYLAFLYLTAGNNGQTVEFRDRIAHYGGLVLNSTSPQTVTGLDLATLSVPAARLGAADYSDVLWELEVYTDGGATASNATINVTYDDTTTGDLNTIAVGGTIRAGNAFSLCGLIPTAKQGLSIKGINTVTLSASTTVAGNFGFTASRIVTASTYGYATQSDAADFANTGFPEIPDDACLYAAVLPSTTTSGAVRALGVLAYG